MRQSGWLWRASSRAVIFGWLAGLACATAVQATPPEQQDERSRLAYFIEVVPGGSTERAMVVYNKWLKEHGSKIPQGGAWENLNAEQKSLISQLMKDMYAVAGEGQKAFKNVALLIDKGLEHPSAQFNKDGHSPDKIRNDLSVMMAQARDLWIEESILDVVRDRKAAGQPAWKIGRSDSGNTTSGMKSDLDQSFAVFEQDAKGVWQRVPELDGVFIDAFTKKWGEKNPGLSLEMLDIVSIKARDRFPDPRVTSYADYRSDFGKAIAALRTTPGAYTTYGAELQQVQLRVLGGIIAASNKPADVVKRRVFQQYGPDGKLTGFDEDLARQTMFSKGMDPRIMQGMAFGAAVANLMELEHYMDAEKFETKYHLRTWDDATFTSMLMEMGANAAGRLEYTALNEMQRQQFNEDFLAKMFPGDAAAQRRHAAALDISADLRNFHKGEFTKIPALAGKDHSTLTDIQKKTLVFDKLARELYPKTYKPDDGSVDGVKRNEKIILEVEQQQRHIAAEFCLRSVYQASDEILGMIFALDGHNRGWIDPEKVRATVQGPLQPPMSRQQYDAEWQTIRGNLADEAKLTYLYALYDLGWAESAKLTSHLAEKHPHLKEQIEGLWVDGRLQALKGAIANKDVYARYYKDQAAAKMMQVSERVQRHVLSELGYHNVENAKMAGLWLSHQNLTWSFHKAARNAVWDPGSLDSIAQIVRSFFESGGDPNVVFATIGNEMFMALPVVGQVASVAQGGIGSAAIMGIAMRFPVVGGFVLAYSIGEAAYSIYDMEYQQPVADNIIDAVFRGFVGPETMEFGEPGKPGATWDDTLQSKLDDLERRHADLHDPTRKFPADPKRRAEAVERDKKRQARRAELAAQIEELKARKQAAQDLGGGAWAGGKITGAGAQTQQKFISTFILKDVKPQIGFFTKSTIDLRVLEQAKPDEVERDLTRAKDDAEKAADVEQRLTASAQASELELQKMRHDDAVKWKKRSEELMEMGYRFKRDSLFLAIREQTQNTTPEVLDEWVDEWWQKNEKALIADLVSINLLPESAKSWRDGEVRSDADDEPIVPRLNMPPKPPIDLDLLKARFRAEVERSRRLFSEYEKQEEQRVAVNARNLERARDQFSAEMNRPQAADLESNAMKANLIAAVRYAAVPRHVPQFEATVYKVAKSEAVSGSDPKAKQDEPFDWHIASEITADDTLYFPPYGTNVLALGKSDAQQAVTNGRVGEIPLLSDTVETLRPLLAGMKSENEIVLLINAYADDMADLSNSPTFTYAHLPSAKSTRLDTLPEGQRPIGAITVEGKPRYLLGQSVCSMSTPAEITGLHVWYQLAEWPTSGLHEYNDYSIFPPIIKMIHSEGGVLTGSCDHTIQHNTGIIERLNFKVNGTLDDKTSQVTLNINGRYVWDWGGGTGSLGRYEDFSGTLTGWNVNVGLANNNMLVEQRGLPCGSVTITGQYFPGVTAENLHQSPEAFAEMAKPKTETKEIDEWQLDLVGGGWPAPEAQNAPKPFKGTMNGGVFTFDQYGSFVEGMVKFPNGNLGLIRGHAGDDTFDLDFWDSKIRGRATLKRQPDGKSWSGPVYSGGQQIDTVTMTP